MNIKYRKKIIARSLFVIIFLMVLTIMSSSCTIDRMLGESYLASEKIESVPDIEIDEYELEAIESRGKNMEKDYKVELEIIPQDEGLKNPFKPYYLAEQEEDEEVIENTLMLEKVYSLDGVKYADIELNGYMYKLAVGDIFNKIYQLQVINDSSVVLLKGDSLITLFLNEIYYD